MATRYSAEQQGVDNDLGPIELGKLADMAFVEESIETNWGRNLGENSHEER